MSHDMCHIAVLLVTFVCVGHMSCITGHMTHSACHINCGIDHMTHYVGHKSCVTGHMTHCACHMSCATVHI